ncbi:MAG: hypothetical protein K2Y71_26095 [Xanthobacteraceae bacterium]|nr:hypothetical protein [Xanthobacteraceae bacterium]
MPFHLRTSSSLTPEQWRIRGEAIQAELDGLSVDELLRGERNSRSSHLAVSGLRRSGYDPNQPRVPEGHPDGGQWTNNGRATGTRSFRAIVDAAEHRDDEFFDALLPRARHIASRVAADYSEAFTGISRIDRTTLALGAILERTMQTMDVIPTWTPQIYGTAVHYAFAAVVRLAGLEGIGPRDVEHGFIDRGSADYHGQPGSIRTDVVLRNEAGDVIAIYDVKTGGAKLTPARIRELRRKTGAGPNVPIIELRAGRARLTRHDKTEEVLGTIIARLGNQSFQGRWDQRAFS